MRGVAVLDLAPESGADLHCTVDVGDEAAVVAAVDQVVHEFGRLDVAVLNAGVGGMTPLLRMTTDEWDRVMRVNLRGVFVQLRECARAMVDGRQRRRDRRGVERLGIRSPSGTWATTACRRPA